MNVLKPNKKTTIITLSNNGISQREIERKTKIDRKTIRKYTLPSAQTTQVDLNSKSPTPATGFEIKIFEYDLPPSTAQNKSKLPKHARSEVDGFVRTTFPSFLDALPREEWLSEG